MGSDLVGGVMVPQMCIDSSSVMHRSLFDTLTRLCRPSGSIAILTGIDRNGDPIDFTEWYCRRNSSQSA